MASSTSGTSTESTSLLQISGSDEDPLLLINQKNLKRMESNRESARRSRMRKQKYLDDLMAQVAHLRKENHRMIISLSITSQCYFNVETENSVLRAQVMELSNRLQSLNEIIQFVAALDHQIMINGLDMFD